MRSAGVLLPVASLPSNWGIGTMGEEARSFIRFLQASGQSYWQILPICQTGFGDSPYQSVSSFAGNPYWIDLDDLVRDGLLKKEDFSSIDWGSNPRIIDYDKLYTSRFTVLKKAVKCMKQNEPDDYHTFLSKEYDWLEDYALYMAIKEYEGGKPWTQWDKGYRLKEEKALNEIRQKLEDDIAFWKGVQYLFYHQWHKMREYASERGIRIIGDTPFYVAADSADVWAEPEQFYLNRDLEPIEVAGCPPDGFSEDGQLWGNPLYDWDRMKNDGYQWWIRRMTKQTQIYDVIRLDHFRGFDSYYAIPADDNTARNGHWCQGPGISLFRILEKKLGRMNIIAEDLGFLTPSVQKLVQDSGYPGMKVLEFAFDERDTGSGYLPHEYPRHCVVYTGTHDNDTVNGWMNTASKTDVRRAVDYFHLTAEEGYSWGMMRGAWSSVADMSIMQAQDILQLGSESRINIPSTLGNNWVWRADKGVFTEELADKLHYMMSLYGRLPAVKE